MEEYLATAVARYLVDTWSPTSEEGGYDVRHISSLKEETPKIDVYLADILESLAYDIADYVELVDNDYTAEFDGGYSDGAFIVYKKYKED